jgi:hypothetical protein
MAINVADRRIALSSVIDRSIAALGGIVVLLPDRLATMGRQAGPTGVSSDGPSGT